MVPSQAIRFSPQARSIPAAVRRHARCPALFCVALLVACRPEPKLFQPQGADFEVAIPSGFRCLADHLETTLGMLEGRLCSVDKQASWSQMRAGRFSTAYHVSWFELPASAGPSAAPALLSELRRRSVELMTEPSASSNARIAERTPFAVQEMRKNIPREPEEPEGPPPVVTTTELTKVVVGGAEGVEFGTVLAWVDEDYRFVWRERMVARGNRLYRLAVGGFNVDPAKDRAWQQMLESFRFVPETKETDR